MKLLKVERKFLLKKMIQEKYQNLLPFKFYSPFQKQCMKEIMNSGKNAIITSPLAIGEQFIPEFSIIKLLQTGLPHLIFYVFGYGGKSMNSEFFISRYCLLPINIQKINKFSDIETDEEIKKKTSIYITSFSDLIVLLQIATNEFISQISLIVFENITACSSSGLDFETFIFYSRKYKYRVVGINHSYEIRDKLCEIFNVSNESKEILTYKDSINNVIELIATPDVSESSNNDTFFSEVKKYLPEQKIVIFCSGKAQIQSNAKLIESLFPEMKGPTSTNNFDDTISDSRTKIHLSKGVGVTDSNYIIQNQKIWELFSNGEIKVIIALYTSYFQIIQENKVENLESSDYKIEVAFMRGNINNASIMFLTPDICNLAIIISDEKNINLVRSNIQGNPQIKKYDESYLSRFFLRLIKRCNVKTKTEMEDAYSHCFNNDFSLKAAFDCLKMYNLIYNTSKKQDFSSFGITELGKIAESFDVDYNDIQIFLTCKPFETYNELLAFLCTKTSTAWKATEVKEGDDQKLRLMLEDPKVPYERSYINFKSTSSTFLSDEEPSENQYDELNENGSFTNGEKAYILILHDSFNNNLLDSDYSSVLFSITRKITYLCSCFKAVSDFRHSFIMMCSSRDLEKRLRNKALNNDSLGLLTQLPGVGEVYGTKLFNSGIKTYQEILELTPQKIKDILKRVNPKLAAAIKALPNYECKYEMKENGSLIFCVSNKGETVETRKNIDEKRVSLICGSINDDKVLYFNEYTEITKPVEICILPSKGIDRKSIEFKVFDSEYIGPDVTIII